MLMVELVLKWYWKTDVNSDSKLSGDQSWKYIELVLYISGVNTEIDSTLKYNFGVDINSIPTAVWVGSVVTMQWEHLVIDWVSSHT